MLIGNIGDNKLNGLGNLDVLIGDAISLSGQARGGNDQLFDEGEGDLVGDAGYMSGNARGGNDRLESINAGERQVTVGDANYMTDNARGGDDLLIGNEPSYRGSIELNGDAVLMSGSTRGGDDTWKVTARGSMIFTVTAVRCPATPVAATIASTTTAWGSTASSATPAT